ncbi:MAG: PIN domain-containing protein [Methylococcaceae bacterium]|nr:PIN domain-containing protein [Methylococcaceae bacterium]
MNLLIDTHTFLWFVEGADELSDTAKNYILDDKNKIYISIVSLWEISIKNSLGKLDIGGEYATVINDVTDNDIEIMPISFQHTMIQNKLPFHHKDPFDRLIIAQGIAEQINIISKDSIFDDYLHKQSIKRIW